jgi:REP element-mobilizing transposase RayT
MVRGNAKAPVFLDADDYRRLLEILQDAARRFSVVIYAFCFMPNHWHLVVQTRGANISVVMAFVVGVYAQWWNRRHGRCGHVTQGRFKAQLIQDERYLAAACRYVMDNPRRAGLVKRPCDWEWSSAKALAGLDAGYSFLDTSVSRRLTAAWLSDARAASRPDDSLRRDDIEQEVARAIRSDARFIGEPALPEGVSCAPEKARSAGFARREWRAMTPPLAGVIARCTSSRDRNRSIVEAHRRWGYTQIEIADHLGLHRDTVGRLIRGQPGAGGQSSTARRHRSRPRR